MAPNRRGVTALSEVNGKGAYARRYDATRRFLEGRGSMKRTGTKRRRSSTTSSGGSKTLSAKTTRMRANLRRGGATVKKADFLKEQQKKGASKKQAEARWKFARSRQGYKTTRKAKPRTYGKGKFRALKAKVGSGPGAKKRQTYLYKSKKTGRVRKIPDYALLGYKSAAEMRSVYRKGTDRQRARLSERLQSLQERREKAATRAGKRAAAGRAWFSPNAGDGVLSYEEWEKMKKNAKKKSTRGKKKATARKKTTAKKRTTSAKRSAAAKKAAATRKKNAAKRSAAAKKAAATRKRRSGKKTTSRKTGRRKSTRKKATSRKASARRTTRKKTRKLRRGTKAYKSRIRNLKKGCKKVRTMKANRKGAYSRRRAASKAAATRRRRVAASKRKRRTYRRNATGAAFKMELKNAFKYGLFVTGGLLVHRVVSNLLATHGLSKIEAVEKTGYSGVISSLVTAAIGIPATVRLLPKHAGVVAAGMATSVLYELAKLAATKLDQPAIVDAISAYPDARGYAQYSGMGAYYQYQPHQVFSGMGQYYETAPIPGLEQAAAGYGALPQLQQMYANGVGEYVSMGSEGIGEYEAAPMAQTWQGGIDEGIAPNTHSAEQALSVAEAAAGVGAFGSTAPMLTQAAAGYGGFGDMPLQSTVDPTIRALDIPDEPGGSRAGILAGGDGIFGA